MNRAWKYLAGNILGGDEPANVSMQEIDILLAEYPFFAGLHYLKAAKVKVDVSENAGLVMSRSALYFHNPHWFQALLEEGNHVEETSETTAEVFASPLTEEFVQIPMEETHLPEAEISLEEAETAFDDKRAVQEEQVVEEQTATTHPEEQWEGSLAENPVFLYQPSSDEEAFEQNVWHNQEPEPEIEQIIELPAEIPTEEIPEVTPEHQQAEVGEIIPSEPEIKFEPIVVPDLEIELDPVPQYLEQKEEETQPLPGAEIVAEPEMEPEQIEDQTDLVPEETTEFFHEPEPEITPIVAHAPEEAAELKEELTQEIPFEPLYTIDYFASQGIKVNTEQEKDQLSLKLRSFTDWLKSMKRFHPEKLNNDLNNTDEANVRENAEYSNELENVLTEAMAEVYLKQGKKEKAVDVFEKLSLIDPSKSAYFALRIKQIKEN